MLKYNGGLPRVLAQSLQLCPTLFDPLNYSPPDSSVPGILQARTLECVAEILQGIFLTQGSNSHLLRLLRCRQILHH